jgi:hypothetical protein
MHRRTRHTLYLGIGLAGLGFALIALAWNGAASFDHAPAQLPYLISGGLAGIGLIVVGVTVMAMQTMREQSAQRAAELARLEASLVELRSLLAPDPHLAGGYLPRPRQPAAAPVPQRPAVVGSGSSTVGQEA